MWRKLSSIRGAIAYPLGASFKTGIAFNGLYTISYLVFTQSKDLMESKVQEKVLEAYSRLITLNCNEIRIKFVNGNYILCLSCYTEERLAHSVTQVKSIANELGVKLQVIEKFQLPEMVEEHLVEDYIKVNDDGAIKVFRYLYLDEVPDFSYRFLAPLFHLSENVTLIYKPIEKEQMRKKKNELVGSGEGVGNKAVALEESDLQLGEIGRAREALLDSEAKALWFSCIVGVEADTKQELDNKTIRLREELYSHGIAIKTCLAEQAEAMGYIHPLGNSRIQRLIDFSIWNNDAKYTMPFVYKTMYMKDEAQIGENFSLPINQIAQKSIVVTGKSRMGKTNFVKQLISHLSDVEVTVVEKADVEGISTGDYDGMGVKQVKFDDTQSVALTSFLSETFKKSAVDKKPRLIIMDEAWRFIGKTATQNKKLDQELSRIAKDGSKHNLGMLYSTQSMFDLERLRDLGIVEQSGIWAMFKMPDETDYRKAGEILGAGEVVTALAQTLKRGEAIIKCSSIDGDYNSLDYGKIKLFETKTDLDSSI